MDIKRIQSPLKQFIRNLPRSINVDRVIVFGSYLEGTAEPDSDIDVIVVSENFKQMDEDQRLDLLYFAKRYVDPEIHPWGFTNDELQAASPLTTLGHARDHGWRFV